MKRRFDLAELDGEALGVNLVRRRSMDKERWILAWNGNRPETRMLELYLMRHGIAVDREDPDCPVDPKRPLTAQGRRKVKAIGRGLRSLKLGLELVLTSPYVRAVETAELLTAAGDFPLARPEASLKPGGSGEVLMGRLAVHAKRYGSILLIGHEPDLSSLTAQLLTGGNQFAAIFKKGGICKLRLHAVGFERCATLEWMIPPRLGLRL